MSKTTRGHTLAIFLLSVIINTELKIVRTTKPSTHESLSVNPDIEDVIRNKVAVLMPMLDDNKLREDSKVLGHNKIDDESEDSSETDEDSQTDESTDEDSITIDADVKSLRGNNSFIPSNQNLASRRNQTLRNAIEKLLKTEPISEDSKAVVNDVLDKITKELTNNNCIWRKRNAMRMSQRRSDVNNDEPSIFIPENMTQTSAMARIKEKWDKMTQQYFSGLTQPKTYNDTVREAAFVFLTRLRHFLFEINDEYKDLQKDYALKCYFEENVVLKEYTKEVKQMTKRVTNEVKRVSMNLSTAHPSGEIGMLRAANNSETEEECNATICSVELAEFLTDFYRRINETQSEIFRNYIEMYVREIDTNNNDKESFTKLLKRLKKHVEKNVKKRFTKETAGIGLIPNFATSKIEVLRRFVDSTIDDIRGLIKRSLSAKLKKLPAALRLVVRKDIQTTANIELGNLQNDFRNKICKVFQTCNGEDPVLNNRQSREKTDSKGIQIRFGDANKTLKSIVDKVNKLKVKERKDFSDLENYVYHMNNPQKTSLRKINYDYRRKPPPFDLSKYEHVKVTRTTYLRRFNEKGTTRRIFK